MCWPPGRACAQGGSERVPEVIMPWLLWVGGWVRAQQGELFSTLTTSGASTAELKGQGCILSGAEHWQSPRGPQFLCMWEFFTCAPG